MSETLSVLKTRRSCRAYRPELIEEEKLQKIIEAGTYAATGMGKQSPIIIAVTNKELRDKLSAMNAKVMGRTDGFDPFYGAPEVLIVLADRSVPTYLYDGSLVMGNLMNAAEDLGVASCWIHRAREEFSSEEGKAILKDLGIEGDYEGIGHLVLGYAASPAQKAAARKGNYVYYAR
jgi:nitroreductase